MRKQREPGFDIDPYLFDLFHRFLLRQPTRVPVEERSLERYAAPCEVLKHRVHDRLFVLEMVIDHGFSDPYVPGDFMQVFRPQDRALLRPSSSFGNATATGVASAKKNRKINIQKLDNSSTKDDISGQHTEGGFP